MSNCFISFLLPVLYIFSSYQILRAMGLAKTASSAVNLLVDIGYFPVHVNLDLLKLNIRVDYPDEVIVAAENLLSQPFDPDAVSLIFLVKSLHFFFAMY